MIDNDDDDINSKNSIQIKLKSILDKIVNDKTFEEGKNKLIEYFKYHISNKKIVNSSLKEINNIVILKGNSYNKILSIIPLLCQINPNSFLNNNIDTILSIFQNIIKKEENSSLYSQISQYFGDTCKILLKDLDPIPVSKNEENNVVNNNLLLKAYNKFKLFCISNMNSESINCQICGTLFLTSFIENCSFNYTNKENLEFIFDNLCSKIKKEEFPAKLEILNCFISLIFCSEEKYLPYAKETLNIIIKFINSKEWLIKKFSLNIIYTMLFYYKEEIMEKKEFIMDKFKILKNEKNKEIKDMIEQIYLLLNESGFKINKNDYSADSKNYLINNKELSNDNINYNININENFDLNSDDEDLNEKNIKTEREPYRVINNYKKNLISNNHSNNSNITKKKVKSKSKSNYKRNIKKSSDINNIKTNKTFKQKNENKKIMDNVKEIIKKIKNKNSVEKSRNSLDNYFVKRKQKPGSMVIKRSNDMSLEKTMPNNKNKNYGFNSLEKYKKILNLNKNNKNNLKVNKNSGKKNVINPKKIKIKKNKFSSLSKTQNNNKFFEEKKIKIKRNVQKENNLRNNNSFEFKNNRSFGNHGFIKIKKEKKLNQNNKLLNTDIKKDYNKDINKYLKNSNYQYIKDLKSDFSNSINQNQPLLNNNNIKTNSTINNISPASNKNNNNITINNNVISITDKINSNKELSSSIENKFIEYQNETSKIINELKSQVNLLKLSLNNYEEIEKNKKNLIILVKNKEFQKAFETAVNIGSIQEINYVIKNYLLNNVEGFNITKNILADVIRILCKDILLCENLRLITMFILKNICEKNILFDKDLNKVIFDVFSELYNKRKELCLLNKDVNNILKIANFFKNKI